MLFAVEPSTNTPVKYSAFVKSLVKGGYLILQSLTPDNVHLIHMIMGISGEAGELLDAVKKATIYRKDLDVENIIEELGDLEFYLEGLRSHLGITRQQVLEANRDKLAKRYESLCYSDSAAQARADKVE